MAISKQDVQLLKEWRAVCHADHKVTEEEVLYWQNKLHCLVKSTDPHIPMPDQTIARLERIVEKLAQLDQTITIDQASIRNNLAGTRFLLKNLRQETEYTDPLSSVSLRTDFEKIRTAFNALYIMNTELSDTLTRDLENSSHLLLTVKNRKTTDHKFGRC